MPMEIHHVYKNSLKWTEAKKGVLSSDGKPDIEIATPAEFDGHEGIWSPEDFFVATANACTMTTFLAIVQRRGIELELFESEAEGHLDTTEDGLLFTTITIRPKVKVKNPEDTEKVRAFLERAHKYCLITNSMKTEVRVEID